VSDLARMRRFAVAAILLLILLPWTASAETTTAATTTASALSALSARSTTQPAIRDVVILNELVDKYEAVPFSHQVHARMSAMWNGCETCHHHTPIAATMPASNAVATSQPSQDNAATMPACKSCHPIADDKISIHLPSLKGAYHRQCLNCHRDWMETNACVVCHAVRGGAGATVPATGQTPTPDDITGRMHKPIAAPTTRQYVARFTPVAGANVLFRHDEHTKGFGIKCAACHHQDTCASCHAKAAVTAPATQNGTAGMNSAGAGSHPMKPGRTWQDTHSTCASCHVSDRCNHCHYQDNQTPPSPFTHKTTGQTLDKDHDKLACAQCHVLYKSRNVTCGDSSCHKKPVSFPTDRPGPFTPPATLPTSPATVPTTRPSTAPATTSATTRPSSKPVIIKIRRGGS